jgi:hypothetical protein
MEVLYLGANLPASELLELVEKSRPVGVCLSAATTTSALHLIPLLYQLSEQKQGPAIVGYGGRFFNLLPEAQRASIPGFYLGFHAAMGGLIVSDRLNQLNQTRPMLEAKTNSL